MFPPNVFECQRIMQRYSQVAIEFFVTTAVISGFTGKRILLLLWTYIFPPLLIKKRLDADWRLPTL
jgi:hypothetical protein